MSDRDRAALNRALAEKLDADGHDEIAWEPWTRCLVCGADDIRKPDVCPRCGGACYQPTRPFCTDLNAAHDALNALGVVWYRSPRGVRVQHKDHETEEPTGGWASPAALATALVQAALQCLQREEGSHA